MKSLGITSDNKPSNKYKFVTSHRSSSFDDKLMGNRNRRTNNLTGDDKMHPLQGYPLQAISNTFDEHTTTNHQFNHGKTAKLRLIPVK